MTGHPERRASLRPYEAAVESMAIWISLARVRRRLLRLVERRLKRVGLPPLLWHDALLLLASRPSCELSAPEMQQRLSLRQYQVSRLIHGLAEGGLVVRRRLPVVGRTMVIQLTARGRELQHRMAEVYASAVESEVSGQFTDGEAAALVALLDRFCHAASSLIQDEDVKTQRRSNPEGRDFAAFAEPAE
jgi:DNA-binding MarR family transcriptional regulator